MNNLDSLYSSFMIQNVQIPGRFLLAPMDGFTDSPFRTICKKHGSALSTSEFINGIDIANGHPYLKYKTYFQDVERPFSYQIFDDDPARLLNSACKLAELHPDIIDVNMGCSARKVSNRGAGAGLLKHPDKIRQIACDLVANLPFPVTAKIRLGWDENTRNYREVVRILEDCGISAITVHARTRKQEYGGIADWDAIAEVKALVSIPVIGNGDVNSALDALKMITHTNCDAVMVGRASLGNPWVFEGRNRKDIPADKLLEVMSEHLNSMTELYSDRIGTILFRKHLVRYLSGYLTTSEIRQHIFSIENSDILASEIRNILTRKELVS